MWWHAREEGRACPERLVPEEQVQCMSRGATEAVCIADSYSDRKEHAHSVL